MRTLRSRRSIPLVLAWMLALVLAQALWAAPASTLDLDGLMALLAQRKSGEARFTEERTVSGLDSPLTASGTLSFTAPDRFARYTLAPRAESMEVEGNTLTLRRGGRTRRLALDAVPELSALADALRGTLSGDGQALARHFRTTVGGSPARWALLLTPLDSRLASQVRTLEIAGQGPDVRSIELLMVGGDRSVMQVEPLTAAAPRASGS
jgi:hypothetical protein